MSDARPGRAASRVTLVTVTFNSEAVLPAMLASVPAGAAVVVVDNASSAPAALGAAARALGAQWIQNPVNEGFGRACNRGARRASTEFLLFLNPDACLRPETLVELVAAADRHPKACAFNPRIEGVDGSPFFKRKSDLLPRKRWMNRASPRADQVVSVLSGAALFVRRAAFEQIGGFDPNLFLFYEDDDLSMRLAATCGDLMHVPGAVVRHIGAASSGGSAAITSLKAWHMGFSLIYTARKHSRGWMIPGALISSAFKLALPPTWFRPLKRRKHLAFLRGAFSALWGRSAMQRVQT